jgi:hypothetical protein
VAKVIEKLGAELDIQPKFPDFQHTMYVWEQKQSVKIAQMQESNCFGSNLVSAIYYLCDHGHLTSLFCFLIWKQR